MKRIVFILLFALAGISTFAQAPEVGINYTSLESRLAKSDKNLADEKKANLLKTWVDRAKLLEDIADVHTQYLRIGLKPTESKIYFKEPKEVKSYSDGREEHIYERITLTFIGSQLKYWEETKLILPNALEEAIKAYEKAKELDVEKKYTKKIAEAYKNIRTIYEKLAIAYYNQKDAEKSFKAFAAFVDMGEREEIKSIDTVYMFYAGIEAYSAKLYNEAIKYFTKAVENKYNDALIYTTLKACYYITGDTAKGVEILNKGLELYPDNQDILVELINYFLSKGESGRALEYLQKAKEKDPTNKSFYFAEGTLYDKMGNLTKATEAYQKACEMDSTYFDSYYNLGVIYFNNGVKLFEIANNEMDNKKYAEKKKVSDEEFKKVIPYMEKALYIISNAKPSDDPETTRASLENKRATLETLKTLYYRLKMNEELKRVNELISEM